MNKLITAVVLAVIASVCGAQETVAPIDKTVPAVEHVYTCPAGYELGYLSIGNMDMAHSGGGPAIMETYTHYEPLHVTETRDIMRVGKPVCMKVKPKETTDVK